jgi:DNA polymerase III subunit epsilon
MPGYLVIDTETSYLLDGRPADAEGQGRLAQLAMIECESAPDFEITRKFDAYVKPDGWLMSPGATAVNHLDDKFLEENGVPVRHVLDVYERSIWEGRAVVAYGAQFDCKILRGELRRAGRDDLFEQTPNLCLKNIMTAICRIPQKNGRGLKWPKLEEAMAYFDLPFEATHNARNDALAAYELLRKINEIGELREPKVYYAKNRPVEYID